MIVLVFEYMLSDLSEVIRKSERPLTEAQVKSYMLMLFKGLAYLHENNIMHRVSGTHFVAWYWLLQFASSIISICTQDRSFPP